MSNASPRPPERALAAGAVALGACELVVRDQLVAE
jgi:hypothetical protein